MNGTRLVNHEVVSTGLEGFVRQNANVWAATMVGAVIGGIAGYMFFTEDGRRWRRQLEPQLEGLMNELQQFRGTIAKASGVAGEGWRILNDAMQEHQAPAVADVGSYGRSSQSHPF